MKSKSREQIISMKVLDQLLENSTFSNDAPDLKGRADIEFFSYFNCLCEVNRTLFKAIITVKQTKDHGEKYYHHYLKDTKIEPYSGTAPNP